MTPLELIKLPLLMARTAGHPDVTIGLIDGPVAKGHPDLESQNIRELPGSGESNCVELGSAACRHGTFVAGTAPYSAQHLRNLRRRSSR
jgi:subtilisin family serine protease